MSSKSSSLTIALASASPLFLASLRLFLSGMSLAPSPVCARMPRKPRSGAARRLRQLHCTAATRRLKVKVKFLGQEAEKARLDKVRAKGIRIGLLPVRQSFRFQVARAMLPPCAAWGALITGRSPTVGDCNQNWASWRAAIKGRLNAAGRASRQLECAVTWCRCFAVGCVLAALCRWTRFRSARQLPVPSPQALQPALMSQVSPLLRPSVGMDAPWLGCVARPARLANRGASTPLVSGCRLLRRQVCGTRRLCSTDSGGSLRIWMGMP